MEPHLTDRGWGGGLGCTFITFTLLFPVLAQPANGQSADDRDRMSPQSAAVSTARDTFAFDPGMNELTLWVGRSKNPYARTVFGGEDPLGRLYIVGLRYGRFLLAFWEVSAQYSAEVIPLAVITEVDPGRSTAYGAGLSPVGLQLYLLRRNQLKLFGRGGGGFLTFTRDVPWSGTRKFNYTFDVGAGAQIQNRSGWAFTLGYSFRHISNMGTADLNPGVNADLLYVAASRIW